jgi:hypothetical protein
MMIRVFLYKLDAFGTHRLPGGLGFETAQPHRDGLRAVEALRASLPPMVFADYEIARAR